MWVGHIKCIGDIGNKKTPKERDHVEDLGVDGVILQCILGKRVGRCGLLSAGSG